MATVLQEPRKAGDVAYCLDLVAHHSDRLRRRREPGDVVSRLGLFMHAAFLHAGLVPYAYGAAQPPPDHLLNQSGESGTGTSLCLSRRYTAPQLAGRKDADAAVLMLCAAKDSSDGVALVIFLTTDRDPKSAYRERLDATTVARCLDAEETERSRIRASLANAVCWGFLDELCRRNGLPPPTGFMSLPDDAKVEILRRLRSGEDLARVECTCRYLRRVVAARDGELWRHMMLHEALPSKAPMNRTDIALYEQWKSRYEALLGRWINHDEYEDLRRCARRCQWRPFVPVEVKSSEALLRWKEEYLRARNRLWAGSRVPFRWATLLTAPRVSWRLQDLTPPVPEVVYETRKSARGGRGQHHKVPRRGYNEKSRAHHCAAGVIHSPSSRNRWQHRLPLCIQIPRRTVVWMQSGGVQV